MTKLMVSIREENFRLLSLEAMERGISIQELLRAVIVPDWVRTGTGLTLQQRNGRGQQPLSTLKQGELATLLAPSARRSVRGPRVVREAQ